MAIKYTLPEDLDLLIKNSLKALHPIVLAGNHTKAEKNSLFNAQRTDAGRELPAYYLCYFLLVELLGFKDLGQFEKISWSVPINYNGTTFLIEHRKFGVGVFASDAESQNEEAKEIVKKIKKAVNIAKPYFEWKASEAAKDSALNVINHNNRLFDRFSYFITQYKALNDEVEKRKDERIKTQRTKDSYSISSAYEIRRNREWMALSAVDAFFSWTEHIFIHIAILNGKVTTGEDVANLADADWAEKFKSALEVENEDTRIFYDQLVTVKKQLRNYMTHGAFGKKGEAFSFHSAVGAVPMMLPHQKGSSRFSFYGDLGFNEQEVIGLIEKFITHLWEKDRKQSQIYIESGLPLILSMVADGKYSSAMSSVDDMNSLVEHLSYQFEQSANMDY